MSILNKYKEWPLRLVINRSNIMDVVLSDDTTPSEVVDTENGKFSDDCLVAFIDSSNDMKVDYKPNGSIEYVESLDGYYYANWGDNEEIVLKDAELTGFDNRLLDINSENVSPILNGEDIYLTLYRVVYEQDDLLYKNKTFIFNGGFLQGFYKLYGFPFQTLPRYIENNEWNLEFTLKPYKKQLYDEAIFFYMGTRAENKFANFYNTTSTLGEEKTSNGVLLDKDNYFEIKTNNKYLPEIISGYTREYNTKEGNNAYLIFSQNPKDYTVDTLEEFYNSNRYVKQNYNVKSDLYNNAFSLFITEKGEIGYKYLINKCEENFEKNFISEISFKNTIKLNEWSTINVKFMILNGSLDDCGIPFGERKMKIFIYVNGYLRLISQELPEFNFRELNDIPEKQEMVPYNISLGGGTLGLSESKLRIGDKIINLKGYDYLSNAFNKRFFGEMKTFKFYNGPLSISDIRNNHFYNKKNNNIITNVIINGPVTVFRGDEFIVSVSFEPVDTVGALVSWKLNDDKLEIVNVSKDTLSCTIRSIKTGNTSISASVDGSDISDTLEMVVEKKPATEIIISGPQLIVRDEEFECHATIIPEDADDVNVIWEVDSTFLQIVNISEDTLSCTIKAIKKGNTSISASVEGCDVSDTFDIVIEKKPVTETVNDLNLVDLVPSMIKYDNFELGEKSFYALYNTSDNDIVVPIERVIKTPRFNIGELSLELEHIFDNNTTNTWVDYFSNKEFIEVTDDNEITKGEYLFVADYSDPKILSFVDESKHWGVPYADSVEVKYSDVFGWNYIAFSNDLYNACCCTVYKSKTSEDKWNIKMPPPTTSNKYIKKVSSNSFAVSESISDNNDMVLSTNNNNYTCLSFIGSSSNRHMYLNNTGFRFYTKYSKTFKEPKMFKLYSSEYCSIGAPSDEKYDAPIKTIITPYVKDCLYNYINLSMDSTSEFRIVFHVDEDTSIEYIVNGETDIILNTSEPYNLSELRVEILSDGIQHSQISFKKLTIYYNN